VSTTIITPPAIEPVSVADARKHCRIDADIDEHDWLLELLIATARAQAEHETGRALITRQVRLEVPVACRLALRPAPLVSIESVVLLDDTGTTMPVAEYRIDNTGLLPVLCLAAEPGSASAMRVDLTVGYGSTADAVPAPIRRWMLLHISTHFENRETVIVGTNVTSMPTPFIDGLLDPYRIAPGF
jgi:uncharacterized phiE125 gp8 family phage protein